MMNSYNDIVKQRLGTTIRLPEESNKTIATILSRRCCRSFKDQPLSDDIINLLMACAQSSPSKSDLQQYSIVILTDEQKKTVSDLIKNASWINQAPLFLMICPDTYRTRLMTKEHDFEYKSNNLDSLINATVDAAIAMQTIILAAEAMGLGCCPISLVRNHFKKISRLLNLPDGVYPLVGLCIGYPNEEGEISMRLPSSVVIHHGKYSTKDVRKEIEIYDKRRHIHQPISPDQQKNIDQYGVTDPCYWSTNVARQLSVPEREDLVHHLINKQFKLTDCDK